MSDLLPNLGALRAVLPDTAAGRDAGHLATAAAEADSWEDTDSLLGRIVEDWEVS